MASVTLLAGPNRLKIQLQRFHSFSYDAWWNSPITAPGAPILRLEIKRAMSRRSTETRFDRYVRKVKDHWLGSMVLFVGLAILTSVGFFESIEKYLPWVDENRSLPAAGGGTQEGEITVTGLSTHDVFYPVPYRSTPNLVFPDGYQSVEEFQVLEQRADGFKVNFGGSGTLGSKIKWKAVGMLDDSSS